MKLDSRGQDFLAAGGQMGERMRALDWSTTPLGPVEEWPEHLRSALSICFNSRFPIAIYWVNPVLWSLRGFVDQAAVRRFRA